MKLGNINEKYTSLWYVNKLMLIRNEIIMLMQIIHIWSICVLQAMVD
jgi:hypothetical protein